MTVLRTWLLKSAFAGGAAMLAIAAHQAPVSVVIVTLDTTRADRLSPYGFMDVSLPALERLAREGVVFEHATSVVPLTLPAHTTLFTGLLPQHHGVRDNADTPIASETPTLAGILRGRGYRTGAFVGSVVLDSDRGLSRGFDSYRGVSTVPARLDTPEGRQRPADEVIGDALHWLEGVGNAPFLLWTHLYDAHRPYAPPEPFRSRYAHDLYLGEIAWLDSQVGRLVDALERQGRLDRTILVVTADHGESLGEHGERDHGVFVYESVLHVPLFVRVPRVAPARVPTVVRLTDVMPTVLDLLHQPSPQTDGVSLAPELAGASRADLPAYSESLYPLRLEWSPLRALREGRFKFIDAPRPELYDLNEDFFEQSNLFDARRDVAEAMRARLASMATPQLGRSPGRTEPSADLIKKLRTLGYVAGPTIPGGAAASALPDPKDCIAFAPYNTDAGEKWQRCGPFGRSGRR